MEKHLVLLLLAALALAGCADDSDEPEIMTHQGDRLIFRGGREVSLKGRKASTEEVHRLARTATRSAKESVKYFESQGVPMDYSPLQRIAQDRINYNNAYDVSSAGLTASAAEICRKGRDKNDPHLQGKLKRCELKIGRADGQYQDLLESFIPPPQPYFDHFPFFNINSFDFSQPVSQIQPAPIEVAPPIEDFYKLLLLLFILTSQQSAPFGGM